MHTHVESFSLRITRTLWTTRTNKRLQGNTRDKLETQGKVMQMCRLIKLDQLCRLVPRALHSAAAICLWGLPILMQPTGLRLEAALLAWVKQLKHLTTGTARCLAHIRIRTTRSRYTATSPKAHSWTTTNGKDLTGAHTIFRGMRSSRRCRTMSSFPMRPSTPLSRGRLMAGLVNEWSFLKRISIKTRRSCWRTTCRWWEKRKGRSWRSSAKRLSLRRSNYKTYQNR